MEVLCVAVHSFSAPCRPIVSADPACTYDRRNDRPPQWYIDGRTTISPGKRDLMASGAQAACQGEKRTNVAVAAPRLQSDLHRLLLLTARVVRGLPARRCGRACMNTSPSLFDLLDGLAGGTGYCAGILEAGNLIISAAHHAKTASAIPKDAISDIRRWAAPQEAVRAPLS
jgi:hypothetical protein